MSAFRTISDGFLASPQIAISDIALAKTEGVSVIVNNRPDGEDPESPQGDEVSAATQAAGLRYVAIPVGHSGFSEVQIDQLVEALGDSDGKVLAYCRSGTRSTLLWALAQAKLGMAPDEIARSAAQGGYDVSPIRPMLDMLASS